jgi:hypothetical protein
MEYQAGGEVVWNTGPYLPSLTVDQARRVMRDVINGVEYRQSLSSPLVFFSCYLPSL